ncbi:MAG: hypothetical protein ACE5DN_02075 [Flavobacteriales bacterium]
MRRFPKIKRLAALVFCVAPAGIFAQSMLLPLNGNAEKRLAPILNDYRFSFHNEIKPYNIYQLKGIDLDSVYASARPGLFGSKKDSAQNEEKKYVELEISPIFTLREGYENSDSSSGRRSEYALGAALDMHYMEKLSLNAYYLTANASYPDYLSSKILGNHIVPAQGYAFGTALGYHHKEWGGCLAWRPSRYFSVEAGDGKQFWGAGYRSLFLSDVASNYPYLKMTTNVWHLEYVNLYANFKDVRNTNGKFGSFQNKFATMHFLSWNVSRRINLAFYESVIWQAKDTLNNRGYDVNYINPVIFFRPVEYALGSSDNSLIGLSSRIKVSRSLQLYGQWLIDEFLLSEVKAGKGWWGNKYGLQAGIKYFNVFSIDGFALQAEVNTVRPYTYTHGSVLQNYSHFGQPLAHPLGANFREGVIIASFIRKCLTIEDKLVYAEYGKDTAGINYGGNIFEDYATRPDDYGHYTGQGQANILLQNDLEVTWMISLHRELYCFAGYTYRLDRASGNFTTNYIYAGIRTGISKHYYDY